jgi:fermentation-respiration switch protein FrsA (DUF1100 family)
MGLFTLMAPPPGSAPAAFLHPEAGYDVTLQASVSGRVAATATVRRPSPVAVGVVEKELRPASGGIYANLYLPSDTAGRRPAVPVFGGSDGGLTTSFAAALLAAHGYPSLALAYFKAPGLPEDLDNIPLEYFTRALRVLRAQPGVDPRHVLVSGVSRGSEAALLLGAYFPQLVNGVIAGVPSSVAAPSQPSARPSSVNPTRPGSRRRSSQSSASGARSCSPAASWTGSGRPVPTATPSPHALGPAGSPTRSSTCAIATPATTLAASRCTSPV